MEAWQLVIGFIGAVVGSAGLFHLIEFLIGRKDSRKDSFASLSADLEAIAAEINDMREDRKRDRAVDARIRILQAADSIRHSNTLHSEEYFDQLNEDITLYTNYCSTHTEFKNNKASHAIDYINHIYSNALQNNKFL